MLRCVPIVIHCPQYILNDHFSLQPRILWRAWSSIAWALDSRDAVWQKLLKHMVQH